MSAQLDIFAPPVRIPQVVAVKAVMESGRWYTFSDLQTACYATCATYISEAGLSARIRDMRKEKYGSRTIESRKRAHSNVWEYRMVPK